MTATRRSAGKPPAPSAHAARRRGAEAAAVPSAAPAPSSRATRRKRKPRFVL
jgi:hypothetical protein